MDEQYVIIKQGLYYKPNSLGYTGVLFEAGMYSKEKADKISRNSGGQVTSMLASEAPVFSENCYDDIKKKYEDKALISWVSRSSNKIGEVNTPEEHLKHEPLQYFRDLFIRNNELESILDEVLDMEGSENIHRMVISRLDVLPPKMGNKT